MPDRLNNYAFIDSHNLYLGVKREGWLIDYRRFRIYLTEKYRVTKAFMFIGFLEENQGLYRTLQEAGFLLIFKLILPRNGGAVKGNCDAELVLHTMIEYGYFDQAVIVTGDGDFTCLVRYLQEQDKLHHVLAPARAVCSSLLKKASRGRFNYFNDFRNKLEYKKKNTP
ncbi:MAG: NYN domain-containing protein [Patescibacteria group bacterium]